MNLTDYDHINDMIATTTAPQPTAKPLDIATIAQILLAYHGLDWHRAHAMAFDPEGAALLALLCNAAAKDEPTFYQFKVRVLRQAVALAKDWWATPHIYGDVYAADTVVYIETRRARFSFHVRADDPQIADLIARAPTSERGWGGTPLQPIARSMAADWLAEQAARVPFDEHDQQ